MDWATEGRLEKNNVAIEVLEIMLKNPTCFYDFSSGFEKRRGNLNWIGRISNHLSHTFEHYNTHEIVTTLSILNDLDLITFKEFGGRIVAHLKGEKDTLSTHPNRS